MKKLHRRLHLLIWLILAPAVAVAGVWAFCLRPELPEQPITDALDIATRGE